MPSAFERLFSPIRIGSLSLKNRITLLPQGTGLVREGAVTDEDIAYYAARAAAGVGLIVTGGTGAHPATQLGTRTLIEAYDESKLPSLERRVAAVHAHDCAIVGQLLILGREMPAEAMVTAPVAPSALRAAGSGYPPHELRVDEVRALARAYGASAANLMRAGCDGIEIHAAHGYLVAQFLSPATNRRNDAYGGSPAARMRFLVEIIDAVRTAAGDDWPLGIRLSVDEEIPNGLTLADTREIVERLESAGRVDYLSLTVGVKGRYVKDMSAPPGVALERIRTVRQGTQLPVLAAGRILTPAQAEEALASGACDLVGLSRALIADAKWAAKARENRAEQIRPCIGANQECRTQGHGGLRCTLNAAAGLERGRRSESARASRPRGVAIIGGGPAGLEAARVAALRGHRVDLFEQAEEVGGQLRIAARGPHRGDFRYFVDYLSREVQRLGVRMHLGVATTLEGLADVAAESVIVATGARPVEPTFESPHGPKVLSAWRLLQDDEPGEKGDHAVVVDDGSGFWHACSAAERLAGQGLRIALATPASGVGLRIPPESLGPLYERLFGLGVRFIPFHAIESVDAQGVLLRHVLTGELIHECADTLVVHAGQVAEDRLVNQLIDAGQVVHTVGDCVAPRLLTQAIHEANNVAGGL